MSEAEIKKNIKQLEKELSEQRRLLSQKENKGPHTVDVPEAFAEIFANVENKVGKHFDDIHFDPLSGEITVHGQRYILFRSDSMSFEFMEFIKERYADRSEKEAVSIGNNFLFDNAKVIGKKDALAFHDDLKLKEPVEKLAAGPVHFASITCSRSRKRKTRHPYLRKSDLRWSIPSFSSFR
jgi:hypothetical protein